MKGIVKRLDTESHFKASWKDKEMVMSVALIF